MQIHRQRLQVPTAISIHVSTTENIKFEYGKAFLKCTNELASDLHNLQCLTRKYDTFVNVNRTRTCDSVCRVSFGVSGSTSAFSSFNALVCKNKRAHSSIFAVKRVAGHPHPNHTLRTKSPGCIEIQIP